MKRRSFLRNSSVSAFTSFAFVTFLTGCVGGEGGEDGDEDGGDEPPEETGVSLTDTDFEILESGGGTRGDEVAVETDDDAGTLMVEGSLAGRNSCYTAELGSAEYDAVEDVFDVNVRSFEDRDEDEMCASVITEIEYRVVASFEGGLPGRTRVRHNAETVAEAVPDIDTED
jgi:hypothetical protein